MSPPKVERIEVTLSALRELRGRIDEHSLEPNDWALLGALVTKQIGRAEARLERMLAKLAAEAAAASAKQNGESASGDELPGDSEEEDICAEPDTDSSKDSESEPQSASGDDAEKERSPKKRKGHGRNGANAYRKAKHFFYALAAGVLGAVCSRCGFGKTYRYRENVIIRIVGQPLFSAEIHHYEQARCRNCGLVIRADGPAHVHEGVGSDYIRYDWSACGMLMVMHYCAGAPFKRLDTLHDGWGVPMPDANQWEVVNAADDLLLPQVRTVNTFADSAVCCLEAVTAAKRLV